MPLFKVKCFEAAILDGNARDIEARDEQEAAELVCGEPLIEGEGQPGRLRAQVRPASKPSAIKLFYIPA